MNKKQARIRRARKTRARIREQGMARLVVYKTPRHIYAQVVTPEGDKVLVSASTLDAKVKADISKAEKKYTGNISSAGIVGRHVAEAAKAAGLAAVAFDRSGFRYHGRIKALADAAREAGLTI